MFMLKMQSRLEDHARPPFRKGGLAIVSRPLEGASVQGNGTVYDREWNSGYNPSRRRNHRNDSVRRGLDQEEVLRGVLLQDNARPPFGRGPRNLRGHGLESELELLSEGTARAGSGSTRKWSGQSRRSNPNSWPIGFESIASFMAKRRERMRS